MKVRVHIPEQLMESVFSECDKYPKYETGGRLLGMVCQSRTYTDIKITDLIDAGPNAKRTATYFGQDRNYQADEFSRITKKHKVVNHLGNWHSHHCNSLDTLSQGDSETYFRTVNDGSHNLNLFIALLIIKGKETKYDFKFFLFVRNNKLFAEIPKSDVLIYVPAKEPALDKSKSHIHKNLTGNQKKLKTFFPLLKHFSLSNKLVWIGKLLANKEVINMRLTFLKSKSIWYLETDKYELQAKKANKKYFWDPLKLIYWFKKSVLKSQKQYKLIRFNNAKKTAVQ